MVHLHSGLRWLALLLIVIAVFNAFSKRKTSNYVDFDRKLNLFAMVTFHVQFLLGWVMYFTSAKVNFSQGWMKTDLFRFFGMEHTLMMTVAFVLLTIGHSKSKKANGARKHKVISTFYLIALLFILAGIPWPFREALGGAWF
ncbi:MAG: cytochrome B [Bacteroidota bacterium]